MYETSPYVGNTKAIKQCYINAMTYVVDELAKIGEQPKPHSQHLIGLGAELVYEDKKLTKVRFASEGDALLFVLRWS